MLVHVYTSLAVTFSLCLSLPPMCRIATCSTHRALALHSSPGLLSSSPTLKQLTGVGNILQQSRYSSSPTMRCSSCRISWWWLVLKRTGCGRRDRRLRHCCIRASVFHPTFKFCNVSRGLTLPTREAHNNDNYY